MRLAICALVLLGCSSTESDEPVAAEEEPPPPLSCAAGEALVDGACLAAGMQPNGCAAGESFDGSACVPAGIPADSCAVGFEPDDAGGCDAILPPMDCGPGTMAIPGETSCRDVAPCGANPWGDIPVAQNTQYVDASYPGVDSDGTAAKPWLTISDGVQAAAANAVVAVAAGSYLEDVLVRGRPVQVWGRCPQMVEIVGEGTNFGAVDVRNTADGSEIHAVALTGPRNGISVSGSQGIVVDQVWIHDTGLPGVAVQNDLGPTELTVRRSLIESTAAQGGVTLGASLIVEQSVVRDVIVAGQQGYGQGLHANSHPVSDDRGTLTVRRSLIERNSVAGVMAFGSDATVDSSVLRDTRAGGSGSQFQGFGPGGMALVNWATAAPSTLTVSSSLVEGNERFGLGAQGSTLAVDHTVIRDSQPQPLVNEHGKGINLIADDTTGLPTTATIDACLIERNQEVGIHVVSATAEVSRTIVRDTLPTAASGNFGRGISLKMLETLDMRPTLTLQSSHIVANRGIGVHVSSGDVIIEGTVISDTLPHESTQLGGRGINLQADLNPVTGVPSPSSAQVRWSRLSNNLDVGIFVLESPALIESTIVEGTGTQLLDGTFGDGVAVLATEFLTADVQLVGSRIEGNARAGAAVFAANATLQNVALACNPIQLNSEQGANIDDGSGNVCGCEHDEATCKAVSSNLQPPERL